MAQLRLWTQAWVNLDRQWRLTCRKDGIKNRKVKGEILGKRRLREAFRTAAVTLNFNRFDTIIIIIILYSVAVKSGMMQTCW